MGINITAEDTLLFEQNGFTYEDVKNTVSHYRSNGLSDKEIQGKLNARVAEFKSINKNSNAFDGAQAINRNDEYIKQCDNDLDQLSKIYFTPEQLQEIDNKGAIGWWEFAKKTDKTERIPFVGTIESGSKTGRLGVISSKIEKGEEISPSDKEFLDNYIRDYIEVSRRGTTWGAKVADVVFDMPAWAVEIGAATAASGGTATIPSVAQKVAIKSGTKAAASYVGKALIKSAQKATVKGVATGVAKSSAVLAPRIVENYAQRRISEGIAITDKGQAYLEEIEEKPAITVLKAFADTAIEAGTEVIGGQYLNLASTMVTKSVAGKAVKEGFKKGFDLLPKKTRVGIESAVQKLRPNETVESLMKKGGFNGVLEEIGEERVADILRTTLDLDPEKGYSADQFMKAINPGADQLLVELGAFSILGGTSRASSILYNNLRVKGYSHEEATNTVNNLSEIEKDNFVSKEIVGDNFTVNSDITKEEVQEYNENIPAVANKATEYLFTESKPEGWGEKRYDIANKKGETLGYVEYSKKDENAIVLDYVHNTSGEERNGIGTALVSKIISENPDKVIIWDAVNDVKAKNFKERFLQNNPEMANKIFEEGDYNALVAMAKQTGYNDVAEYLKFLNRENEKRNGQNKRDTNILSQQGDDNFSSTSRALENNARQETEIGRSNTEEISTAGTKAQKTARERLEEARNNYKEYKKVKKESERFWSKILAPISTELDEINPKLKHALRRFEMESALKENEYAKPVKAFIDATNKMSKEDYAEYDLALKNRDVEMINELNKEYSIQKEFEAIRQLLDGIYKEAQEVGMEIGMLEDYFPRKVINPAAFIEEVSKSSFVRKALQELDPDNKMSAEDKAIAVNNILRGYGNKISLSGGGFTKERSVQEITPELNKYYKDSIEALTDYIKSMNNVIQAKKFFGKGENVEESIGGYVKALAEQGMISARDEAKAKEILLARFTQRGPGEFVSFLKNIDYLSVMGSPTSAITQIGDFAFSLYQNGFYDSLIGFSKALSGKGITREDIGIDKIAQEFSEKSKTSQAVNVVFKAVGLDFMDKMGKETFINASYKRLKDLANKPNDKFDNMLKQIFGREANQVKEDLKNGIFSENVKYLLFSELSDFQPISLAEMPQKYLTGGNGRIWYMLKTYTVKLLDVYRNQIFRQFRTDPKEAMTNLIKLSAMLVITNATADAIKDLLLGRPIDLDDLVTDNLIKLAGFSKWQIYQARREGIFYTALRSILPPLSLINDLYKDGAKAISDGEIAFKDLNIIKDVPVAGKLYYWWFGKGSNTEEKSGVYNKFSKKFNAAQKANTKLKDLQGEEAANFKEKRVSDLEAYMILKGYNNQIKKLKQQRKLYEKANNKEGVKNINARIDEVAKAGLEALR